MVTVVDFPFVLGPGRSLAAEQFHLSSILLEMCPPAAAPLVDMNECNTNEELFMFMLCLAHGHPVPASVITDVNPFNCLPETLAENMWYFINSMENNGAEGGFWKLRGRPREIYGNASITGWQATHEFYRGSHVEKTNWLMLEYYITPTVSREADFAEDANSLCRVFYSSSSPLSDSENYVYTLPPDNFNIPTEQWATNQMQGHLTDFLVGTTSCSIMQYATGIFPSDLVDDLPELDQFGPGDYLELLDLGTPQSPSSGSDDSSCVTMLSDDCFDYLEAMLDLEAESGDHVEDKDAGRNLNVSESSKPENIAVQAANSGLPIDEISSENARDGKAVNKDSSPSLTLLSQSSKLLNGSQTPSADGRFKKLKRKYLPTSSSQSSDGSNSGRAPSPSPEGRTKTEGTLKKLQKKYLCFMPF